MRNFSFPSSKLTGVPDTVLRVDNKSGEVRRQPTQVFPFVGYKFHLDLALVNPLRGMAQFSGFDPTLKSNMFLTSGCLMSLTGLLASTEKMVLESRMPSHETLFSFTSRSTGDILSCNSPKLARDALVWGPSAALNRDPTSPTSVNNSSHTVPQLCVFTAIHKISTSTPGL